VNATSRRGRSGVSYWSLGSSSCDFCCHVMITYASLLNDSSQSKNETCNETASHEHHTRTCDGRECHALYDANDVEWKPS
jgi:hypothetical protein